MTTVEAQHERAEQTEIAVSVVDCDVHPYPSATNFELVAEHTPEPWRSRLFAKGRPYRHGESIIFDPPEYAEAKAQRIDTRPPGGGFPCTDPEFAFEQLMNGAGVHIAMLGPIIQGEILPEVELARRMGYNGWLDEAWLGKTNGHGRWRGSICVTLLDPEGSAREIERWAGHPYMAQALVIPEVRFGMGDPRCDPIYEAACRHGLPVSTHIGRGPDDRLPLSPVGPGSWYIDHTMLCPFLYESHLASLVFDGAFDRFPTLRIVMVEGGFTWLLPLIWRMDAIWNARKGDVPWVKRAPSEYIREHVRFTTQPMEDPDDLDHMIRYLEWMDAGHQVMFSTDYPHFSSDDPTWAMRRMPKSARPKIMHENATELYGLPATVPSHQTGYADAAMSITRETAATR